MRVDAAREVDIQMEQILRQRQASEGARSMAETKYRQRASDAVMKIQLDAMKRAEEIAVKRTSLESQRTTVFS